MSSAAAIAGPHSHSRAFVFAAIIRSSLWVSAAITSMLYFCGHVFGGTVPIPVYVLLFASVMFVMNFDHLADGRFEAPAGSSQGRWGIAFGVLAAVAAVVFLYFMALVALPVRIVCICYSLIGVAYGLPFFPLVWRRPVVWRRLKDIGAIKAWLVSAAIVFAMVGLTLASSGLSTNPRVIAILAAALYLFVVSNAHMFDIRDLRYDRRVGNRTLPTLIGASRTRRWLLAANVAGLLLIAAAQILSLVPFHPELELGLLLTIAYIRFLPDTSTGPLYALVIDGCLFILPVAARLHEILGGGAGA